MKTIRLLPLAVSIAALVAPVYADSSKANNTTALNVAGSWTNGIIPGAADIAIWDSNFSAAVVASQAQLGADTTWLGIKVTNVSGPINTTNTGAGILSTGSAQTLTIGSSGIDMSAATQAFLIQSKVTIGASQTWNIANANTQNSTFTALNNADDLGFFAQAAGTAFNLGGNTVTTTGAGGISFSSGYAISNGTFNIGNPLFEIQGGTSRLTTVASSVTLNVPTGSTLHFQATSGAVTSDAAINLNGGTLKFVNNTSGVNVTVNGTVTVNAASTINVGPNAANGSAASGNGTLNLNANLVGTAPLNVTNTMTAAAGVGTWSRLLIAGNNSGYSGTITLGAAGSTAGKVTRLVNASSGSAAATWNVAANHTLEVNGVAVDLGTLTGAGTVNSATGASALNVGAGDFAGTLSDGGGTLALNKVGNGTLTLTGFNSYSGATTVNRGSLIVTPSALGFTPIDVNDGGTFAVQSAISAGISGNVTVNAGGTVSVRQQATGVTITMPSLTTTNGAINIDTDTFGNPASAPLSLTAFNPTATTIRVSGSSLTIANGIPLISYSGVIGGGGFVGLSLSLPTRTVGVLVNNAAASRVDLNITSFEQIKWKGNVSSNWDVDPTGTGTTGTPNWLTTTSAAAVRFLQGTGGTDTANFDDTAATGSVNLTTVLTPVGVIVNNSSLSYTFSGPGRISGATSLTKTGTGILTIANTAAYDYSGGTTIGVGGALRLGDGTTSGAGVIGGAITANGTLILNRPDDHVFANAVSGTGKLQKEQPNTVTISSIPVMNDVAINAGTLRFDAGGTVNGLLSGTGVLSVTGGTLLLAGTGNSTFISIANVSGGTLQLNNTGGNAIGGTINISGTGGLTLSQANQIEDSTVINYNKAANGGNIIIGNETFAALNMTNGADAGGQVQANNGFAVTGLITAQNTSVFAVASNHSGSAGGVNVSGAAVIRIAANGGPSTLSVGVQGITASGGTIQVGQGTGAFDALLNIEGNVVTTANFAFTDGGLAPGGAKREINLGAGNHTFDIASGTTTTIAPDIAGVGGITKLGNGTLQLTLASASTYTGPTTITAGTFLTNTSQMAGPIAVGGGTTIGVSVLAPGTTLTATSLDSAANSTVIIAARALGNPTTPVISAPTLNINGATTLRLTGGNFANGTAIPLIDYTGTIGGLGFAGLNIVLPLRVGGTLVNNTVDSRVDLMIVGLEYPKWNGNVSSNWDIDPDGTGATGTANWITPITNTPTRYFQGPLGTDTVTFDDTAAGSTIVNLTTLLTPVGAIVNNTNKTFTFAGGGRLTGNAVLTKNGTGTLILANTAAYDHTDGTTINEGTLQIGDGVTAGAGLLPTGVTTNNATVTFNRPDIATMGGGIAGPGTLIKLGAGTVTLTGALTYTGPTLVNAGILAVNSTSMLAGPITIAQGGTLRLDNTGGFTSTITNNGIVNLNTTQSLNTTVEGTGGVLVNTAGARAIGGFAVNTFTGLSTVSAGNLTLSKSDGISGLPAIGGDVLINGTGVITVGTLGNQFADTSSITVEQGGQLLSTESAAVTKPDTIANLTINAATPISTFSGLNITGTLKITAGAQHDMANSGGTTSANTALFSNTSVRLGINGANSVFNVGTGGVTLTNATILYGSAGVATFLGTVNLDGNVTGSGTSAFDVNTGNPMSRIDLGVASRTFNIIDGTTTIEPSITSSTATSGVIKSGNGILLLAAGTNTNGVSTYPGETVIGAGTLIVQGMINGTSAVNVSGTLAGTGTISPAPAGNVKLLAGGKLSPGPGVSTLSMLFSGGGGLDITAGITASNSQSLLFDLNNFLTGDVVFTTGGALKIGNGLLEFNDFVFTALAGVATDQDFILFDGDTPIDGTLGPNISGLIGAFTGELRLANGNTDIIVHIPEPASACLLLSGLAMLGARRRRG